MIGAEKYDAGPAYPAYAGLIDEIRLSTVLRYPAPFTRPSAPFTPDAATAALYHLDEGSGTLAGDSAPSGPSPAELRVGGAPRGPIWVNDTPFSGPPPATPTPRPPCVSGCLHLPYVLR